MSGCEKFQELISRMIDGELDAGEQALLAEHLKVCPDCARLYAAFSALSADLAGNLAEPPEALHEDIMAQVRRSELKKANRRRLPKPYRSLLAAAACIAVIAGFSLSVEHLFPAAGSGNASAAPASAEAPQAAIYQSAMDETVEAEEEEIMPMRIDTPEFAAAGAADSGTTMEDSSDGAPLPEPQEVPSDTTSALETVVIQILDDSRRQELFELLRGEPAEISAVALPDSPDYVFALDGERTLSVYMLDGKLCYRDSAEDGIFLADCTQEQFALFIANF